MCRGLGVRVDGGGGLYIYISADGSVGDVFFEEEEKVIDDLIWIWLKGGGGAGEGKGKGSKCISLGIFVF